MEGIAEVAQTTNYGDRAAFKSLGFSRLAASAGCPSRSSSTVFDQVDSIIGEKPNRRSHPARERSSSPRRISNTMCPPKIQTHPLSPVDLISIAILSGVLFAAAMWWLV